MANYLDKFKGSYQLRVDHNEENGEFFRDSNGELISSEVFINCKKGRIYHYGGNVLTAYVEPCETNYSTTKTKQYYLGTYGNTNKCIARPNDDYVWDATDELIGGKNDKRRYNEDGSEYAYKEVVVLKSYKSWFDKILNDFGDIILPNSIMESDVGGSFRFKAKDIDKLTTKQYMDSYKRNLKASPFSKRYLPKNKYDIPKAELDNMKKATLKFTDKNRYLIAQAYKQFDIENNIDMNSLKKEYRLSSKQIYHKIGYFDKIVEYITNVKV